MNAFYFQNKIFIIKIMMLMGTKVGPEGHSFAVK